MDLPDLGVGLVALPGLGPLLDQLKRAPSVIEIEPQAYWSQSGADLAFRTNLDRIRQVVGNSACLIHSVGLAVGGLAEPDPRQWPALIETLDHFAPPWWSDHAAILATEPYHRRRRNFGFLMPPVQTDEAVDMIVGRIKSYQDRTGRPFAFETGVNYLQSLEGELPDGQFWGEIADRADCGILLDLHNIWTNERNGRVSVDKTLTDMDQPLVQYEGSDTSTRRWLHADERGSIIAISDASGATFAKNSYDEYGIPGSSNYGRFQYTGQMWLPELGMYYYKARIYSPTLGRFLQTDPIGYGDGPNWYNYVQSDPLNNVDPLGLDDTQVSPQDIFVFGSRLPNTSIMDVREIIRQADRLRQDLDRMVREFIFRDKGKLDKNKKINCNDALKENGEIQTKTLGVSGVLGLGLVGAYGTWHNVNTGTSGTFSTIGFGAGLSGGGSLLAPSYSNIRALTGMSDGVSASFSISFGPVSVGLGYSASWNDSGTGGGFSFDVGSGGMPGGGAMGTYTDTKISNCRAGS